MAAMSRSAPRRVTPVLAYRIAATAASNAAATRTAVLIDDRFAKRNRHRVRACVRLELGEDVPHVALHRLLADEQLRGDVRVRHAVGEQLEDLALAAGEHVVLVTSGEERRHERRVDIAFAGRDL